MCAQEAEEVEVPLRGGRVTTGVVRVGDTVRRPATDASPFVADLLHLYEFPWRWQGRLRDPAARTPGGAGVRARIDWSRREHAYTAETRAVFASALR